MCLVVVGTVNRQQFAAAINLADAIHRGIENADERIRVFALRFCNPHAFASIGKRRFNRPVPHLRAALVDLEIVQQPIRRP